VAVTGGSGTLVSRAYVCTLVTEYGEEGAPSTPVLMSGFANGSWSITIPATSADLRGGTRNITKIRLYRTIVTASGFAQFFLVSEFTATGATQSYTDITDDTVITSKPILPSDTWTPPPNDLEGIVAMHNGIVAGFRDNEIWFSAAYRPHAWPAAHTLVAESKVVGIAVVNQSLVVCTEGYPCTISGANPNTMSMSKLQALEPCIARGSILGTPQGVFYTSPNGLVLVNPGQIDNLTRQAISKDVWKAITGDAANYAGRLGSAYFAHSAGSSRTFDMDAFQNDAFQDQTRGGSQGGFMIDPFTENVGFNYVRADVPISAIKNDLFSGELLTYAGRKVYWMDFSPGVPIKPYKWRSKIFQTPVPVNFKAFKAYFNVPSQRFQLDTPNHALEQTLAPNQYILIRVYADGRHIATRELQEPGELHMLPSGFKAEFWEIEVEARVRFKSIQMGQSVKELSNA
jgi:hypothetical protein